MTFGYLIVISKSDTVDYLKLAYCLALTIKITQPNGYNNVAIATDCPSEISSLASPWVFDNIIEFNSSNWDGRVEMDLISPYDATVCLDADIIMLEDISSTIQLLMNTTDLYLPTVVNTYRYEPVSSTAHRETFVKNNLPNIYSLFTFFKKGTNTQVFDTARAITKFKDEYSEEYLSMCFPKLLGTDEALALSLKIHGIPTKWFNYVKLPVVHLKPQIQNWNWSATTISDYIGIHVTKHGEVILDKFLQRGVVHYVEKSIVTDEVISIYENILWKM